MLTPIVEAVETAAQFGATPEGGVTRLPWTPPLFEVYDWLRGRAAAAGFASRIDAAGNLRIEWDADGGPALALGSHLDTVPNGGRLDGALGVLSAFEALQLLRERGFTPSRPIWLLAFIDEEGARFGTSFFGSRAFCGEDVSDLGDRLDADGVTLRTAMTRAGFGIDGATEAVAIDRVGDYLELHIEQGPVLERSGDDIGVVTAIVGQIGLRIRFRGEVNHAGTTPIELRRDALVGAARFAVALAEEMRRRDDALGTVAEFEAEPGGFCVPGVATLMVDIRSTDPARLAEVDAWVRATLAAIADAAGLEVDIDQLHRYEPAPMSGELVDLLCRAASAEGARYRRMPSGASHDAALLARHVQAGMLFVPSRGGISHNPAECTASHHLDLGVRVLSRAVAELAG